MAHQHPEHNMVLPFLSVCHVVVLYLNEGIYRKTFPPSGSNIILVFEPHRCYKIPSGTPSAQV